MTNNQFLEPEINITLLTETDESVAGHITSLRGEDWGGGEDNNFKINPI